ncbi:FAD-dependent oxidoreductase [Spongisporangium articulatum]|uniref:FAD-dependent oxidoreductase n=1 Tax=Spongisporangium articulatum TaxID=3362603 RepID=A0ABW8AUG9_9ACTN
MDSVDVLVVGSGGAALTAAALAAHAGLRTLVLERTGLVGGTSAYSGGACWLPGTRVQRRAGVADSTESAREYLGAVLHGPDPVRLEAFLAHAPELVTRLEDDLGIGFEWLPFPEYYDAPGRVPGGRSIQPVSVPRADLPAEVAALVRPPVERDRAGRPGRATLTGGQALVAHLLRRLLADGGRVATGHRVTGLLVESGRVTGVVAETVAGAVDLRAEHGVVLACGGFEGHRALRQAYGVPGDAAWSMAPVGTNTGEPLLAAVRAGAATAGLDQAWLCPGLLQPDGRGSFTLGFRGGVMVDAQGRRYANEALPYDRFGRAMAADPARRHSWLVFDSREGGGLPALAMPEGDVADHLAAGTRVCADSIEKLASTMRVPGATLQATVERFNRLATAGHDDDFGRGVDEYDRFFAPVGFAPLDEPPYYAARFVLSDLGTKGGLVTDAAGRVLRGDGSALPGLYATGNTAANLVGDRYPAPGVPLGTGMVFGSLAVLDIAKGGTA